MAELWKHKVHADFAKQYLAAMCAYDATTNGVSISDYVDCEIEWDYAAVSKSGW